MFCGSWNVGSYIVRAKLLRPPASKNSHGYPWASCSAMVGQLQELDQGARLETDTKGCCDAVTIHTVFWPAFPSETLLYAGPESVAICEDEKLPQYLISGLAAFRGWKPRKGLFTFGVLHRSNIPFSTAGAALSKLPFRKPR